MLRPAGAPRRSFHRKRLPPAAALCCAAHRGPRFQPDLQHCRRHRPSHQCRCRVRSARRLLHFCCILCHVETAFLLIGISFLHALLCDCLGSDDRFLCFCLRLDQIRLLAELRLGNVGIFAEMQLLEFSYCASPSGRARFVTKKRTSSTP